MLERIFEPSFTTKRTGTGLGLATCHSIVTQLGGAIDIRTQVGKGTTFSIFLPALRDSHRAPSPRGPSVPIEGVLVVDDERAVREMTARMLETKGYRVYAAASLSEARGLIADPSLPIDALVTDVVLSEEMGTDLLATFRQHHPSAKLVVVSGYSPDPNVATIIEAHGARFLAKPFAIEQLVECLAGSEQ